MFLPGGYSASEDYEEVVGKQHCGVAEEGRRRQALGGQGGGAPSESFHC